MHLNERRYFNNQLFFSLFIFVLSMEKSNGIPNGGVWHLSGVNFLGQLLRRTRTKVFPILSLIQPKIEIV